MADAMMWAKTLRAASLELKRNGKVLYLTAETAPVLNELTAVLDKMEALAVPIPPKSKRGGENG